MRILLVIHNVYTDPTSGAARSMRTLMEWLAEAGHEVRALATARFDARTPEPIEDHLAGLGVPLQEVPSPSGVPCPVVRYLLDGVLVTTLVTRHNRPERPDAAETAQLLDLLAHVLDDFRPDVLHTYGGHPVVRECLRQARRRGVLTTMRVANYGYEDRRWFADVEAVLTASPYLSAYYRDRIGLDNTGIFSPIRWAEVRAAEQTREFVTFVNPSVHKGLTLFARLADRLGSSRPDIPILVVQSASEGKLLKEFSEIDFGKYRHIVAGPPTPTPADFFGLTKILLVPSVFAEPFGRVAAEALINGIPPLVSDRGSLPETVAGAGRVLPLPGWMQPTTLRLPSAAEVAPWYDAVCELWDDAAAYDEAAALARQTGERLYGEAVLKARYLDWFAGLRRGRPLFSVPESEPAAPARAAVRPCWPCGLELEPGASFFHLCTPPGQLWPPVPQPALAPVWAAYLELDRSQWLSREEIEARQLAQVRALLGHCLAFVPYYRRLLADAGLAPSSVWTMDDFRRLPLLDRRTLQERSAELQARHLPLGMAEFGKVSTSGSSGVPVEVRRTDVAHLWWLACCLRDWQWGGFDARRRMAVIRYSGAAGADAQKMMEGVIQPSWHPDLAPLIEMGAACAMDVRQDPRRQLQWLRQTAPDYLLGYPSNLAHLAGLVRQERQKIPSLRAIQSFAEALEEPVRRQIEEAFGVPVKDLYSCGEAGYLASPCPEGHGLHVHAENVLLEVLDDAGRPCGPGATGRVVLTALHNFLTPLIRYDIGDEATVGPERCPCGRGLPLLARVGGKRLPLLVLPDGRRKAPAPLVAAVRQLGVAHQYQIVQKTPGHVVVRLVPGTGWTAGQEERLRQVVRDYFEAAVEVDVEVRDRPSLTAGGKVCVVSSEIGSS
jgi:phenylacetate-CoA ligase